MTEMKAILDTFLSYILDLLPTSPIAGRIDEWSNLPYMGWLNWFFPVGEILDIMGLWLGAIALYYMYSIIMRWLKVIR